MAYIVTSTEKTTGKAAEHETKAMLYLMNFHKNSNKIYFFVVDFFNDVTGIDSMAKKAWDVQSKSSKNLSGMIIGRYLVTLYKNYLSDLDFDEYILFVGGINPIGLIDKSINVFNIDNFNEKYQDSIKKGIKDESLSKDYIIDKSKITDDSIIDFLTKTTFVINDKSKSDYIKKIIETNSTIIVDDEYLEKIFDQIRDKQAVKKNMLSENISINFLMDFDKYNKHLTSDQIKLMILSRLVNRDLTDATPTCFTYMLDGRSNEERVDLLDECRNDIKRMLFNKNNIKAYWDLFEDIYIAIKSNPNESVEYIFNLINPEKLENVFTLNFKSARFFIALIKEGIKL